MPRAAPVPFARSRALHAALLVTAAVASACARGGQRVGVITAGDGAIPPDDACADDTCAADAPSGDACVPPPAPACVEPVVAGTLAEVRASPPGAWLRVANSHLRAVAPTDAEAFDGGFRGVTGVAAIVHSSGAALDTRERRLLVWGGGYSDYLGNEVYAFGLDALRWSVLVPPSHVAPDESRNDALHDGHPSARETFDQLVYLPDRHALFSFGGGNLAGCVTGLWLLDLATLTWQQRAVPTSGIPRPYGECQCAAAFDPVTQQVVWFNNGNIGLFGLWAYDSADAGQWNLLNARAFVSGQAAAVDSRRHQAVTVGRDRSIAYDLAPPYAAHDITPACSDATAFVARTNPGFDYDPTRDRFVGWAGAVDALGAQRAGGAVYTLDPGTTPPTWSVTPGPCGVLATPGGIFGRWRYAPSLDAFVLMVGVDEDVFLYRPAN